MTNRDMFERVLGELEEMAMPADSRLDAALQACRSALIDLEYDDRMVVIVALVAEMTSIYMTTPRRADG